MAQRCFSLADQLSFAELSGDFNPVHVDPIVARRTLFGRPIVHGINLLLWSLNNCLDRPFRLSKLKATFASSVGVGEPVTCSMTERDRELAIVLENRGVRTSTIKIELADGNDGFDILIGVPERTICREFPLSELPCARGSLNLVLATMKTDHVFPGLTAKMPAPQIALLLATTRLVGMECPGFNSIYSRLTLDFDSAGDGDGSSLFWHVESYDPRFSRAVIAVNTSGVVGSIDAHLRPQPQMQPSIDEIRSRIAPNSFVGRKSLVIGGSRGIGEACAKILAAGSSEVRVTYRHGIHDADSVVKSIAYFGGRSAALPFDVLSPPANLKETLAGWFPTNVYYFATPPILPGAKGRFSQDRLAQFCEYYIHGVVNSYESLRAISQAPIEFFYPSSVFLDQVPNNFGEYVVAKSAGETLCRYLASVDQNFRVRIERLPRLPTDQTAGLWPDPNVDIVEVLAKVL